MEEGCRAQDRQEEAAGSGREQAGGLLLAEAGLGKGRGGRCPGTRVFSTGAR